MSRSLEQKWIERYRQSIDLLDKNSSVFTGFNVNLDVIHKERFEPDQEAELLEKVENMDDLKAALRYCRENGENHELDYQNLEIDGGDKHIGGQGGIISNFLAETENEVILYTQFLSDEIAEMMNERILYPVKSEDVFYLKNVQDAVNSSKTKKNHIFEFEADRSGRLILSGRIKGYGPYLPQDIEEELPLIQNNIDSCIFSGFHNVTGNKLAKLKKAGNQLSKIEKPVHLEYVHKGAETSKMIVEHVIPEVDSLGLDETELGELLNLLDIDQKDSFNFGESFSALKKLIRRLELSRIHLHTYRYHITVTESSYEQDKETIRDSMLYGELAAVQSAENGEIPDKKDIREFNMENKNIQEVQELADFGNFHDLKEFARTGTAEVEGYKVAGIPIINHHDPERTVGMGDIISAGAFSTENTE